MKIGSLVRSIHNGEIFIVTSKEDSGYHEVYGASGEWLMPKEHLEVIDESR